MGFEKTADISASNVHYLVLPLFEIEVISEAIKPFSYSTKNMPHSSIEAMLQVRHPKSPQNCPKMISVFPSL
jgi:hypothetical protein